MAGQDAGTVDPAEAPTATSGPTQLLKFGEHLFLGVVSIKAELPPGLIYSYDLVISRDNKRSGLRQERLLEDETSGNRLEGVDADAPLHLALGYLAGRLPSFVTPAARIDGLHLAHGSCRKSNGKGPDALAWLDDELARKFTEPQQRVQQLFLTGDQIYSDDLGACLLIMLNCLGREVLGREERLPVLGEQSFDGTTENFPPMRRAKLIRETARLSSTACSNHLLTFGEFAAMYMAAWSPRVWRGLTPNTALFAPGPVAEPALYGALTYPDVGSGSFLEAEERWMQENTQAVNDERERVQAFRDSVPKVARALANVPTYMIFDDHEITDDWNLNKRWRNRVYSAENALGRAIMRNGMMAYGLFQAWGNDPDEFAKPDSKNKLFLDEAQRILGTDQAPGGSIPAGSTDLMDELVGSTEADNRNRVKWHYQVRGPLYLVVVLDTRTRRTFRGQGIAPPSLLGNTLNEQVPDGPLTDGRELLIVVSAAPVLMPLVLEQTALPAFEVYGDFKYAWEKAQAHAEDLFHPADPEIGVERADAEGWAVNELAREDLLKRLARHRKAIILSGDVHHGLTMQMDHWTRRRGSPLLCSRIVQLTSSSLRNSMALKHQALARSNALLEQYAEALNSEVLAWDGPSTIVLPDGAQIAPARRARLHRSPSLVPASGWPAGTTIPVDEDKQPSWRWRLKLVADERPSSEFPPGSPRPPNIEGPDLDPRPASTPDDANRHLSAYQKIVSRHQSAALSEDFSLTRRIVFATNLGLVDVYNSPAGKLTVSHTLLSQSAMPPHQGVANTVHVIPLDVDATEPMPGLATET